MELRNDKRVLTEGIAAYEQGLSYTRCPYESDTSEYVTWIAGWSYADRWADTSDYLDPPPEWFEKVRYSVLKGVNTAELEFTQGGQPICVRREPLAVVSLSGCDHASQALGSDRHHH